MQDCERVVASDRKLVRGQPRWRKHASEGAAPAQPSVPEPSFAERGRTLMYMGRIGSLSTLSRKQPGFPFGSGDAVRAGRVRARCLSHQHDGYACAEPAGRSAGQPAGDPLTGKAIPWASMRRKKNPRNLPSICSVNRVSEGQIWASSRELTPREQAVVQLVADGLSNREIATHLKLSRHTVKNYRFRVFDKIGVSSRVELVLCALTSPMADPTLAPHSDQAHASICTNKTCV